MMDLRCFRYVLLPLAMLLLGQTLAPPPTADASDCPSSHHQPHQAPPPPHPPVVVKQQQKQQTVQKTEQVQQHQATAAVHAITGQEHCPFIRLESVNYPGDYLRHRNFFAFKDKINFKKPKDVVDSKFKMNPGLADPKCFSLSAVNFTKMFLSHQGNRVRLGLPVLPKMKADATWCFVEPKDSSAGDGAVTLRSQNSPDHFLRHRNGEIWIDTDDGSDLFKKDATWKKHCLPN